MGLLDDAIREHLELKRKHGADPDAVARQEKEALGPGGPRAEFAHTEYEMEPPDDAAAVPEDDAPAAVGEPDPEPADEPEPVSAPPAPPARDPEPWLEETAEHHIPPAPRDPEDDDVLEETPDFLSETPEHDRLWFEQKPPKDFDWDK